MDIQGVLRGRCTKCSNCSGYRAPANRAQVLCDVCHHAPGLHQNMSQSQLSSAGVSAIRHQWPAGASQTSISERPYAKNAIPYAGIVASTSTGPAAYGSHSQTSAPPPVCKRSGCSKPVHWDPTFGKFDYCTPQCRDADLLESDRNRLQKDIDEYMKPSKSPPLPSGSGGHVSSMPNSTMPNSTPPMSSSGSSQLQRSSTLPRITIKKSRDESVGIILLKSQSFSAEADNPAFLVTGVVTRSPAFQHLKDGRLKLLSLIARVGDKDVKELDETFDDYTRRMDTVELSLDMGKALSLGPPSGKQDEATHIIAVQYESTTEDIGIEFEDALQGVVVEKVKIGKVPQLSGICARDIILPKKGIEGASAVLASLTDSQEKGKVEVLYIKRK